MERQELSYILSSHSFLFVVDRGASALGTEGRVQCSKTGKCAKMPFIPMCDYEKWNKEPVPMFQWGSVMKNGTADPSLCFPPFQNFSLRLCNNSRSVIDFGRLASKAPTIAIPPPMIDRILTVSFKSMTPSIIVKTGIKFMYGAE